ncbi:hypothetical protein FH972_017324 [Carpinus fangiana]|uniref:Uncharacterized protein n=1 Tax=Carpinus fangiana TaxID=176857 RepID=A0A5N6RIL3_9ROSI|nr:hypothetical protein FH972_017324 [Carpinus fangiana]
MTITQKSGISLQIGVTASYSTSEIYTDSLAMKQLEVFEDQLAYEDRFGERTLLLTKNYQDELIKFEAEIPQLEDIKEEKPEYWDLDDENKIVNVSYSASITKGSGMCLEFLGTISNEEICIHSVLIKQPEVFEDRAYEGPSFIDLDENLLKAFLKYLAIRGNDFNTFDFIPHHMLKKRHREYFLWLEKIKNFIEKPPHS